MFVPEIAWTRIVAAFILKKERATFTGILSWLRAACFEPAIPDASDSEEYDYGEVESEGEGDDPCLIEAEQPEPEPRLPCQEDPRDLLRQQQGQGDAPNTDTSSMSEESRVERIRSAVKKRREQEGEMQRRVSYYLIVII